MAIQDDILSMFRRIGDAGDRATRRGEAGLAILDQLTPMERMQLSSMYNPEQFSSLEEAMTFNPLIGSKALDLYQARVEAGDTYSVPETAPRIPVAREELPNPIEPPIPVETGVPAAEALSAAELMQFEPTSGTGLIRVLQRMKDDPTYRRSEAVSERNPEAFTRMIRKQIQQELAGRMAEDTESEYDALSLGAAANLGGVRAGYVAAKLGVRALGGAGRIIRDLLGQGRIAEAESMVDDILYQVGPAQARNLLEGFRRTALPPPSGGSMPQISGPPTIPRLPGPPSRGQLPSPPPVPRLTGTQMRNPETGTYMPRGSTYVTPSAAGRIGSEYGPPMFDGPLFNKGGAVRQSMIDRYKRMY